MNYLILATGQGFKYGRRITYEIRKLRQTAYLYRCYSINLAFRNHPEWNPTNLIIHSRAANPNTHWMNRLVELEQQGYRIVNNTACLRTTSDKWESIYRLEDIGNIPYSYCVHKGDGVTDNLLSFLRRVFALENEFIAKPRISQGNGANVHKVNYSILSNKDEFISLVRNIPGDVIIQKRIPYTAIYRVFVIGGRALFLGTRDTPTQNNWKVSVCLNRNQVSVRLTEQMKDFAEMIQQRIGGEINFIDIYRTAANGYVLSEVNTACNLTIHERLTGMNIAKKIAEYLISLRR